MDDIKQRVFVALADPTRRYVIEKLSAGAILTATDLADELPISRQGVSKHMKILEEANLVTTRHQGRERLYILSPKPLAEAVDWVTAVNERWASRLKALHDYLAAEEAKEQENK
ncbi:MAG: metalloregulator ArsR/SmtB family transcription factor [Candidatus Promineifilaceae bacterium]